MIDAKQAVLIAKQKAAEILGADTSLEEIERQNYNSREVWSITLSFARDLESLSAIARFAVGPF